MNLLFLNFNTFLLLWRFFFFCKIFFFFLCNAFLFFFVFFFVFLANCCSDFDAFLWIYCQSFFKACCLFQFIPSLNCSRWLLYILVSIYRCLNFAFLDYFHWLFLHWAEMEKYTFVLLEDSTWILLWVTLLKVFH